MADVPLNMPGILVGIAGGSGSGKSVVASTLLEELGYDQSAIVQQDAYYRELSHLSPSDREKRNFDHPDAIDVPLLTAQVQALMAGKVVETPVYDFMHHERKAQTRSVGPVGVLLLEGILVLHYPQLRDRMDIKAFVDTDPDIRLMRRIRRDTKERGRTVKSVMEQWEASVRPMHLEFVEPSKRYADVIIPGENIDAKAVDLIKTRLQSLLDERGDA